MRLKTLAIALLFALLLLDAPNTSFAQDIVGKVIAGYQGWFAAQGDGSPVGLLPQGRGNSHLNLEMYPDMREYPMAEQFAAPSIWGNLPNGNPATVFASDRDYTINLHVSWMKEYGIDCAAVQRFGEVYSDRDTTNRDQKNEVTLRMMRACEKTGVKFYIEYDASGSGSSGWGADWPVSMETDWNNFAVADKVISSPAYARENGKPVVEIWGLGFDANNISKDPAQWASVIQWFKGHGYYVICGVPTGWLVKGRYSDAVPGFDEVYPECDAISPWVVGRFRGKDGANSYAENDELPESQWCKQHGIAYIPCVYPGTSFYNSNGKTKNIIPRDHGVLMWAQYANIRNLGLRGCFVSMFDEFNEATEIAKAAESAASVPSDKWFLTMDADGDSVSSDYYLRLTKAGSDMLKGITPLSWDIPITPFNDIFASGFEHGDVAPTWSNSPDKAFDKSPVDVTGISVDSGPVCEVRINKQTQSGAASLFYSGTAQGGKKTYCRYKVFGLGNAVRPIDRNTILYYWIYPEQ